ncbi:MAG TPA: NADH-quinone oxidoreductase subunit NuoF [Candidatus Caccosoma faecigallinarum]|uniref:NADH-quinone oxidoreductase subunit NuoF n=1 Tax=Candidatus Caccosoma faecigallinarum TaxID=2840720 RepID=A0A9D1G8H9_9FIRM|nr:NADH-quinone oxidoreductase subunit NuoF [Candidatus Caccosoma faecigallinarum]
MIKTQEELAAKIASCKSCLDKKFAGAEGKRAIILCGGTGCLSSNSAQIAEKFKEILKERNLEDDVSVNIAGCFGFCSQGPFVKIYPEDTLYRLVKESDVAEIVDKDIVNHEIVERLLYVDPVTKEKVAKQDDINFYKKQKRIALHGCGTINPENIEEALGYGAFQGLANALKMDRFAVIQQVLDSGLRGRGGGGFPTGLKWKFAYDQENDEKYVVCNGDEGDPGAFMDRSILEGNPLAVIEGMMIAGYAIGAKNGYFYVRAEYPVAVKRLRIAIQQAEELGLLGDHILNTDFSFRVHIRLGAGAFVCGEETALLNSIEGKRGMPRPRPPFPAVKGLWDKPTIINNVETLATVPYILREGKDVFTQYGTEKSKGTKVFALGGKINNVGLVEIPMGTTLRELIYDIGGGIPNGKKFKAIQTGGPSGGCLTEEYLDTPIDFDNLVALGSMMGSGGAIVMDEDNCMVDVAKFYMEFICDESCGKCSPCRIGTKRMLEILTRITEGKGTLQDIDALEELGQAVKTGSLCGLGQTAANPIISTLTHFKDEYIAHVVDKKCPAKVCKKLMQYYIVPEKCKKCSLCARNCPVSCIKGEVGKTVYEIDQSRCIKCGMCQSSCRFNAIEKR